MLFLVNIDCFATSTFERYHCNATRRTNQARTSWHRLSQIDHPLEVITNKIPKTFTKIYSLLSDLKLFKNSSGENATVKWFVYTSLEYHTERLLGYHCID